MVRQSALLWNCDILTLNFSLTQVGDGTTTVVLLAAEFLKEAKPYVEDGVHPHSLIRSYRTAGNMVCNYQLSLNSLPTRSLQLSKAGCDLHQFLPGNSKG